MTEYAGLSPGVIFFAEEPGRCGAASARRGGDGRLALDPSTPFHSAQDDTRGFHGRDDRARLKAGGCLPHPFMERFNMKRADFAPI